MSEKAFLFFTLTVFGLLIYLILLCGSVVRIYLVAFLTELQLGYIIYQAMVGRDF